MKLALLFALLTGQPEGLREKPEATCTTCSGGGYCWYWFRLPGFKVQAFENC